MPMTPDTGRAGKEAPARPTTPEWEIIHGRPPAHQVYWCADVRCAVPVRHEGDRCPDHDGTVPTTHLCGCGHKCYGRARVGELLRCDHGCPLV